MSHLSKRTVRRPVTRPNAAKALERIDKEMRVLIENSPIVVDEFVATIERDNCAQKLARAIETISNLYRTT